TFKYIGDDQTLPTNYPNGGGGQNSEVHNAGEIWCSMMFDAYVALLKNAPSHSPARTFAEARRQMQRYVVAGLMMTPKDATYTEQRDAILAAAAASDKGDAKLLVDAF